MYVRADQLYCLHGILQREWSVSGSLCLFAFQPLWCFLTIHQVSDTILIMSDYLYIIFLGVNGFEWF